MNQFAFVCCYQAVFGSIAQWYHPSPSALIQTPGPEAHGQVVIGLPGSSSMSAPSSISMRVSGFFLRVLTTIAVPSLALLSTEGLHYLETSPVARSTVSTATNTEVSTTETGMFDQHSMDAEFLRAAAQRLRSEAVLMRAGASEQHIKAVTQSDSGASTSAAAAAAALLSAKSISEGGKLQWVAETAGVQQSDLYVPPPPDIQSQTGSLGLVDVANVSVAGNTGAALEGNIDADANSVVNASLGQADASAASTGQVAVSQGSVHRDAHVGAQLGLGTVMEAPQPQQTAAVVAGLAPAAWLQNLRSRLSHVPWGSVGQLVLVWSMFAFWQIIRSYVDSCTLVSWGLHAAQVANMLLLGVFYSIKFRCKSRSERIADPLIPP